MAHLGGVGERFFRRIWPPRQTYGGGEGGGGTFEIPPGVDWFRWRLILSERLTRGPSSLSEMNRDWTMPDMLDAHSLLNAIENAIDLAEATRPKPPRG